MNRGEIEKYEPAAFGRLCVETPTKPIKPSKATPAAFGRLCVETILVWHLSCFLERQPPSGGCVLKPAVRGAVAYAWYQPPSGGCVLKQGGDVVLRVRLSQPPSGGCVLKRSRLR